MLQMLVDKTVHHNLTFKLTSLRHTKNNMTSSGLRGHYHIHCGPFLGFGPQAVRTIPCWCESCTETKKSEGVEGKETAQQIFFQRNIHCKYASVFYEDEGYNGLKITETIDKPVNKKSGRGSFESGSIIWNRRKDKKESIKKQVWRNYYRQQQNTLILYCKVVHTSTRIERRYWHISSRLFSLQWYINQCNTARTSLLHPNRYQDYCTHPWCYRRKYWIAKPSSSIKTPKTCNFRATV